MISSCSHPVSSTSLSNSHATFERTTASKNNINSHSISSNTCSSNNNLHRSSEAGVENHHQHSQHHPLSSVSSYHPQRQRICNATSSPSVSVTATTASSSVSSSSSSRQPPPVATRQKPSRLGTTTLITITSSSTTAETTSTNGCVSTSPTSSCPSREEVITDKQSPDYSKMSTTKSILSSVTSSPPIPEAGKTPMKILLDHWAEYVDSSGRRFYYNSVTHESSWKPPRRRPSFSVGIAPRTRFAFSSIALLFFSLYLCDMFMLWTK